MKNLWEEAKSISVQTGADITGGFNIGFQKGILEETKDALMEFVYWVEDHYPLPITLWVDFQYKHYLICDGKRVGYRFYWVDYPCLDVFENFDDIPVIELPVRVENQSLEAVLKSFAAAISHYYAWLQGLDMHTFVPEEELTEAIVRDYYNTKGE